MKHANITRSYTRLPKLRQQIEPEVDDHFVTTAYFIHTNHEMTTYFHCHEVDSSTESVLRGRNLFKNII